ncbi:aldehyde dehydrogenase family protein [Nocardia carnea]|uniref:aldehyde dehydrogenase family protein n=1 Tax=Nocardia carnea TaxID=37328 RepID=UPI002456ACEF|nr:aldehyde dehydrogenase family protein [Nocardia carnea]
MSRTFEMLIGGRLTEGDRSLDVINPATEEVIARCACASEDQVDEAVEAAAAAFPAWAALGVAERSKYVSAIADVIEQNQGELASVLTAEQGKPLSLADFEVSGAAAFFRHAATFGLEPKTIEDTEAKKVLLHRRPLGVVAAITAWNFPLLLMAFKLPSALMAGNTVVAKPAATTPLATLLLGELISEVVPSGVINIIADANDLGDRLTGHPKVAKISFTGSTATGLKVAQSASRSLKRMTLELGGNDAGIVLDDADPAAIAPGIFAGAFMNSGQACIALKRLYVHDSIHDELVDRLTVLVGASVLGNGADPATTLGPLQNRMQYERVLELLDEGREKGRVVAGGNPVGGRGFFVEPTLIVDIDPQSRLVQEEQFGPVLPVIRYSDLDEVIDIANESDFGLGASVWTSNPERAQEIAARLHAGTVWINQHIDLGPHIPQAGAKTSGIGIEMGEEGLLEYTQPQVVNAVMGSIPSV